MLGVDGEEEFLDKLLQDGSWQGGWQKEGIVEGGRILERSTSLASCWTVGIWTGGGSRREM